MGIADGHLCAVPVYSLAGGKGLTAHHMFALTLLSLHAHDKDFLPPLLHANADEF